MKANILCVGELLWDALPKGLFPGGAPFNVACHLKQLGNTVRFASRVGNDELGRQAIRRAKGQGIATDLIQVDTQHPTGIVNVDLDRRDNPVYTIEAPAAWDYIDMTAGLEEAVAEMEVLVYGSLAQRHETSRETIRQLRHRSRLNVFDINLRPPFDDREIVLDSLADAHIAKMNEAELRQLAEWFNLSADLKEGMIDIARNFDCKTVCVTCGANGSALFHNGKWTKTAGVNVTVKDAIGAGDAFLAALLTGILKQMDGDDILSFANAVGAYIASQDGATAPIDMEQVKSLQAGGV